MQQEATYSGFYVAQKPLLYIRVMLLDSGMSVANRNSSQTRRVSQVFLQQQPSRRVSRARLLSTEDSYGGSAPAEKSIIDNNFFQDIQDHSYGESRLASF